MGRDAARIEKLVRRAWLLGADTFIIQDWGLLAQVNPAWPEMECHVSTQVTFMTRVALHSVVKSVPAA